MIQYPSSIVLVSVMTAQYVPVVNILFFEFAKCVLISTRQQPLTSGEPTTQGTKIQEQ